MDFTINEPTALTATADAQTNVSCNGEADGTASVAVSGGTTDYTYDWTGTPTGDGTASVTDLAAGAISCTVTDANGCTATVDFTINEPTALTATADAQTNVSCNGEADGTASVAVSGGTTDYTYDWTGTPTGDGTASVTDLAAGAISCTVTDANGCTATVDFTINEPAALTATITSTDGVTLVVSEEATSYQWIDCSTDEMIEGATSETYVASENGEYAVLIMNEDDCIAVSDCFSVTTVGFAENTLAETLVSLFPNPTKESLTIELTEINETSVLVYNTQGKLVLSEGQVQSGHIINISSFEPGVYFVKGTHDQGTWMKRIVKM
ncbi:hypothetical protein GCM10009118_31450 [Wandonia haliotis]|uniref:Secretion system C-terminal sorting domain-containing protein n=1 Tax=Wandonia haliotis TaxID=574963 RepID=A0ABP3Y7K2_9FLAO